MEARREMRPGLGGGRVENPAPGETEAEEREGSAAPVRGRRRKNGRGALPLARREAEKWR